jgi:hypothetical protein
MQQSEHSQHQACLPHGSRVPALSIIILTEGLRGFLASKKKPQRFPFNITTSNDSKAWHRDGSVCIVTRLRAGAPEFYCRQRHRVQTSCGTHQMIPWALFPWVKQPWREAGYSLPSSAGANNAWRYSSTPHTCLWYDVQFNTGTVLITPLLFTLTLKHRNRLKKPRNLIFRDKNIHEYIQSSRWS